jgi:hypothetical protein
VLVPCSGGPLGEVVDELELLEDRIRYYDHEVPIAPGTRVDGRRAGDAGAPALPAVLVAGGG